MLSRGKSTSISTGHKVQGAASQSFETENREIQLGTFLIKVGAGAATMICIRRLAAHLCIYQLAVLLHLRSYLIKL